MIQSLIWKLVPGRTGSKFEFIPAPTGGGLQQDVAGQPTAPELPQALAVAQHVQNALEALVHLDLRQVSNVFFHHKIVP